MEVSIRHFHTFSVAETSLGVMALLLILICMRYVTIFLTKLHFIPATAERERNRAKKVDIFRGFSGL
ncbi:MAG: hypothetical protein NVS1B11_24440 [Terriglobales bacterium]